MKARRKADLPEKICAACGRPFAWRKKWARDWDEVRYCSERCRRERPAPVATVIPGPRSGTRNPRSSDRSGQG